MTNTVLEKRMMVRLSEAAYQKLKDKARKLGHRPSTYVRFLIECDIDGQSESTPEVQPDA